MRFASGLAVSCCAVLIFCGPGDPGPSSEAPPPAERTGPRVYVTNEASGDLSIIDAGSHEVIATVPLGKRPRGIRLSGDGKLLYVALSGSPFGGPGIDRSTLPPADKSADGIGVFDIEQNKLTKILDGGSDPEQLAVSLDGTKMYVANEDVGMASIVDIAENRVLKTLEVGDEPEGVGISPNGKFVYVTSEDDAMISVIDTASDSVVKTFAVGLRPRTAAFSPDSSRAYISSERSGTISVVDTANHEVISTIQLSGEKVRPMGIAVAPDGGKIYVTTGRGRHVVAIDTTTNEVVGSVEVGERPWVSRSRPTAKRSTPRTAPRMTCRWLMPKR